MYRPPVRNARFKTFSWWLFKLIATIVITVIVTAITTFYVAKWGWSQVPEETKGRIEVMISVVTEVDMSEITVSLERLTDFLEGAESRLEALEE